MFVFLTVPTWKGTITGGQNCHHRQKTDLQTLSITAEHRQVRHISTSCDFLFTGLVLIKRLNNAKCSFLVVWSNVFRYEVCVPVHSTGEKLRAAAVHHPDSRLGDTQVQTDATLEDTSSHSDAVTIWFPDHKKMTMFFVLLETFQNVKSKNA